VGVIPKDWEVRSLGEIASLSSGGTPSRQNSSYWSGDIPWITTTLIDFNMICEANEFITSQGLENSAARVYNSGTLLMAMYGQGKTRGKIAILGIDAAINQACVAIEPVKTIASEYIFFNLAARYEEIRGLSNIGNQENLNVGIIESILLPVPPTLGEQRAIAEVLSDVDALIAALDRLIAKKRAIKQGAMQQLLTGQTRLPRFSDRSGYKQTEVGMIPEDWEVRRLEELCSSITDGTHYTPKYVSDGIPFYSVENVTANNFTDTKFISPEEHAKLIKRCKPERGDILLTRIGSLGDTKLINWDVNASIYVSLALLKPTREVHAGYLHGYSKSNQFVRDVEKRSLLNAAPRKINMGNIGNIPIPLPPLPEQRAIAAVLSDMDAEIAALEARREKTRALKQGMMQELLTGRRRLV
jgi:type I restriction enzyme S subunit